MSATQPSTTRHRLLLGARQVRTVSTTLSSTCLGDVVGNRPSRNRNHKKSCGACRIAAYDVITPVRTQLTMPSTVPPPGPPPLLASSLCASCLPPCRRAMCWATRSPMNIIAAAVATLVTSGRVANCRAYLSSSADTKLLTRRRGVSVVNPRTCLGHCRPKHAAGGHCDPPRRGHAGARPVRRHGLAAFKPCLPKRRLPRHR